MDIVFGIDVSKHSSNVAILIEQKVYKEFKMTGMGLKFLKMS